MGICPNNQLNFNYGNIGDRAERIRDLVFRNGLDASLVRSIPCTGHTNTISEELQTFATSNYGLNADLITKKIDTIILDGETDILGNTTYWDEPNTFIETISVGVTGIDTIKEYEYVDVFNGTVNLATNNENIIDGSFQLLEVSLTGTFTTLSMSASIGDVEIKISSTAGFYEGAYIVINKDSVNPLDVELFQVKYVSGSSLILRTPDLENNIFSSNGLNRNHSSGVSVYLVDINFKNLTTDYTIDLTTGDITLVASSFTIGNLIFFNYEYDLFTIYNEGSDFDVDYEDGIITRLKSGNIPFGQSSKINYQYTRPCLDPKTGAPRRNCPNCFTENALVNTKYGIKKISEIKLGERVLTKNGNFEMVTNLFQRDYSGEMVEIKCSGLFDNIECTPNHKFYGIKNHKKPRPNGENRWFFNQKKNHHLAEIVEIKAADIEVGDLILSPTIPNIEIPIDSLDLSNHGNLKYNNLSNIFEDNEFLRIVGLYIAEGCSKDRESIFSYHSEEYDLINFTKNFFEKHGIKTTINIKENCQCTTVSIFSSKLARWFKKNCGDINYNKKIPYSILYSANIEKLLWGYIDGDGHKRKNRNTHTLITTSKELAIQLTMVLNKLNKSFSVYTKPEYKNKYNHRESYRIEFAYNAKRSNRRKVFIDNKLFLQVTGKNIKSVKKTKVYNLEVKSSHTYTVNTLAVKNCNGFGFISLQPEQIRGLFHIPSYDSPLTQAGFWQMGDAFFTVPELSDFNDITAEPRGIEGFFVRDMLIIDNKYWLVMTKPQSFNLQNQFLGRKLHLRMISE